MPLHAHEHGGQGVMKQQASAGLLRPCVGPGVEVGRRPSVLRGVRGQGVRARTVALARDHTARVLGERNCRDSCNETGRRPRARRSPGPPHRACRACLTAYPVLLSCTFQQSATSGFWATRCRPQGIRVDGASLYMPSIYNAFERLGTTAGLVIADAWKTSSKIYKLHLEPKSVPCIGLRRTPRGAAGRGRWAAGRGRWAAGRGQWATGRGRR
jgi:hypothetical protein